MANPSPLSALAAIVVSSIQTLEAAYSQQGAPYPSLDEPFTPGLVEHDLSLAHTTSVLVAAATQIIAIVRPPMETIQEMASAMYMSATLGLAVETSIPTILQTSGTQGLHVRDIGPKAGIDESKTARILRYLATRHVFKEVAPDVFANNRISSVLANPKVETDPVNSEFNDAAPNALVGWFSDECLKSSAYIREHVRNKPGHAAAPFNMAFETPANLWDWYEELGNERRLLRFSALFKASSSQWPSSLFTRDVYWKDLTESDVVVDVGGNVGGLTSLLVQAFPKPRYVVQDLRKVIVEAEKFWNVTGPEAISEGKVTLQEHNFFEPQPVRNASVYVMRVILHDWSSAACHRILSHLRAAASSATKLIVFEAVMPYACSDTGAFSYVTATDTPYPLLPNVSSMGTFHTMVDMGMLTMLDGQERTVADMANMARKAGWKLETVEPGVPFAGFIFTPV